MPCMPGLVSYWYLFDLLHMTCDIAVGLDHFAAMAADGAASGAAAAGLHEAPEVLAATAADGAASGAAAGFNGPEVLAALAADGAARGSTEAATGSAAAGIDEAPELTGAAAAPPQAVEAPQTPPLRPRGPFTDEEWERRQGLKRRAERDIAHALEPLQKWMLEQVLQRHQQTDTIEFLRRRLETTTAAMESMERHFDRLRPPRRTRDAAASDED